MAMLIDEQVRRNKAATARLFLVVFVILAGLVFAVSYLFLGDFFITAFLAVVIGLIYLAMASSFSVAAILKSARARPANPQVREEKLLLFKVEELALAAGIPVPKVYIQEDDDINAFATGRKPEEGIVCVTTTALKTLDQEELEGVLAHELSHIRNQDIRVTTYAIALIGIIAILGEIVWRALFWGGGRRDSKVNPILILAAIAIMVLAPLLSRMVYFAISRRREYLADASGAELTRNPEGLAQALEKIAARQPTPHHG
ncbi:MAG TPA: M48 family metalloprotease, partial [Candidatus Thermoplasmatota archaeon]|nr:M48 family metalloprotease [Candidatus Thermoplasmatota archaeon]